MTFCPAKENADIIIETKNIIFFIIIYLGKVRTSS
nr:MAG TPA: hypothetical protein [Caudoviricetes sp.]